MFTCNGGHVLKPKSAPPLPHNKIDGGNISTLIIKWVQEIS